MMRKKGGLGQQLSVQSFMMILFGILLGTCATLLVLTAMSGFGGRLSPTMKMHRATELEKPPSRETLGVGSWTLLHSTIANFDPVVTGAEEHVCNMIHSVANLYPCDECREHFAEFVKANPPNCSSRDELLLWSCKAHNEVNGRKMKSLFPCAIENLDERWKGCGCEEKQESGAKPF